MSRQSKFLSLVLRHQPERIGLTLDKNGWVKVNELMTAMQNDYPGFSLIDLDSIVETNDKKRFEFDVTGERIRACQGHSINVDLGLTRIVPPFTLYHGTAQRNLTSILETGIEKRSRTHVHLSETIETAESVGRRYGVPIVLTVRARAMHTDGHQFFQSTNGVWLTDAVPAKYLVAHVGS
jgi:putative RNA 2'-phosphotransferase